jgi:sugar lactone lactonase YvrE
MTLIALEACAPAEVARDEGAPAPGVDSADPETGESGETGDTRPETGDSGPVDPCAAGVVAPDAYGYFDGFAGAEDFAFDNEGYLVSVNNYGALFRKTQDGDREVIAGDVGTAAGTHMLADGDIAICNVERGTVERYGMDGSMEVIVSGLLYPNGMDVDAEGYIYVAEQTARRVRRVDPATGDYEFLATQLNQPNGVAWNPTYTTLFIGSFGGDVVYAIDRAEDGTFGAVREYSTVAGAGNTIEDDCADLASGEQCYLASGAGVGACSEALECESDRDTEACATLGEDDACSTELMGETIESVCSVDPVDGTVFCPRSDTSRIEACADGAKSCELDGANGSCTSSWEGVSICVTNQERSTAYTADCTERVEGEACEVTNPAAPDHGVCTAYGADLYCIPDWYSAQSRGYLDGIAVDECDNVYVTEYIQGIVWQIPPDGSGAREFMSLDAQWIPNIHWGNGHGGWEKDTMYIMDRDKGGVFALDVDVGGKVEAYDLAFPGDAQ